MYTLAWSSVFITVSAYAVSCKPRQIMQARLSVVFRHYGGVMTAFVHSRDL